MFHRLCFSLINYRLIIPDRDWEMHIHFRVGNLMAPKELYGDGLAIWLTKDRMATGPVFGSIDYFQGLGIFLDTYR